MTKYPNRNGGQEGGEMKTTFMGALEHAAPQPVSLICVPMPGGGTNLAPVAWWTFLESDPPMLGFSMAKESYTCELLSVTDSLILCLPGEVIADKVLECGLISGREVNKAEKFNIDLVGGTLKYPAHSKLAYECTVAQRVIVGDCVFFVCHVNEIFLNENERHIYTWGKEQKLKPVKET